MGALFTSEENTGFLFRRDFVLVAVFSTSQVKTRDSGRVGSGRVGSG